jgi:uncharacterized protein YllA (UPF0747 family)
VQELSELSSFARPRLSDHNGDWKRKIEWEKKDKTFVSENVTDRETAIQSLTLVFTDLLEQSLPTSKCWKILPLLFKRLAFSEMANTF